MTSNTQQEMQRWCSTKEGQFFERKSCWDRSGDRPRQRKAADIAMDIAETLSAMANADGGELIVGIDNDGKVTGVPHAEDRIRLLVGVPKDRNYVTPSLPSRVREIITAEGLRLLHFEVDWSPDVHHLADSRTLLRVDDRNSPFPSDRIAALKTAKAQGLFERSFPPSAQLDHLDLSLVSTELGPVWPELTAEDILRQLRKEDPAEFDRIADLRDGIRTARASLQKGLFVFCQAGRFQQLLLLDDNGSVISRDIPRVVGTVKCAPDVKAAGLPDGHNKAVMAVRRAFAEEVKHREAERKHTFNLTHGQLYALRELRILFEATTEEEIKGNVNVLEKAFRCALTGAVKRELNQRRRNAVTGDTLYKNLIRIYDQHNLKDVTARRSLELKESLIPHIVCSEAFV